MSSINSHQIDLTKVMSSISSFAPIALLVCAILSFITIGIFCVDYYEELLKPRFSTSARGIAILIATLQELIRFGLLVASVRDFSDSKPLNGWLGLLGSLGLVWHDMSLCSDVAIAYSETNFGAYEMLFYFLILIGFLLEIRLVLTVKGASLGKPIAVS